jgi:hypothetical protein
LAQAGQALGITLEAIARGRDGQFILVGICWVIERSFAWPSRYRRLNTIFERSKEHLIAFVAIASISILSRCLKRLVAEELGARRLQTDRRPPALCSHRPLLQLMMPLRHELRLRECHRHHAAANGRPSGAAPMIGVYGAQS